MSAPLQERGSVGRDGGLLERSAVVEGDTARPVKPRVIHIPMLTTLLKVMERQALMRMLDARVLALA